MTGAVGDTVFLPAFNGLAVYYGIVTVLPMGIDVLWYSVAISIVFSSFYFLYCKKVRKRNDWMVDGKSNFSVAGWYHFLYVILQSFFISISLLYFYTSIWLWLVLVGYVSTKLVQSPNKKV